MANAVAVQNSGMKFIDDAIKICIDGGCINVPQAIDLLSQAEKYFKKNGEPTGVEIGGRAPSQFAKLLGNAIKIEHPWIASPEFYDPTMIEKYLTDYFAYQMQKLD